MTGRTETWSNAPVTLSIMPVPDVPEIRPGDDLAGLLITAAEAATGIEHHDIWVVSQKVVSKAEGRLVKVDPDDPLSHKPLVLREAKRVLRRRGELIITETHHGYICANSGIDRSNVAPDVAALLPEDSDRSARRIRDAVKGRVGVEIAVIVADTFGRPWRRGITDIALGCAGIIPVTDLRGTEDAVGRELHVTEVCVADELCGAAELVRGKADGIALATIRGGNESWFGEGSIVGDVVRPHSDDLFR